ncbi:MAG: hypothetical protein ICV72_01275 [Aldersonia sp.]|nr:hypothetical protein [Aldersonia sp.]
MRMAGGNPGLDEQDLSALSAAVAAGKRPTVYLRDAVPGLGLPAGASAKVVGVEGSTVTVRPRGVDDELPYEPDELRLTRKAPEPAARARPPRKQPPRPREQPAPVAAHEKAAPAAKEPASPPRVGTRGRRRVPTTVTLTLHADVEGSWTVAVQHGERPQTKPASVAADAVERAVAELGDAAATRAVRSALEAARAQAAQRVAELSRELDEARRALAALGAEGQTS